MTMAIDLTVLNKNFCYCNNCIKNNTITKLNADKSKEVYVSPCEHKGRYFSYLKWCDKCGNFTYHRGNNIKAECYSCVMSKNSLKAIEKGLHSCQNPETSLANKKLHQKTIESQIKNGTFNMMQPEIHAKATKNKMKNYASGKCKCKICGKEDILNCYGVCGECQGNRTKKIVINNKSSGYCSICGIFSETRDQNARCPKCNKLWHKTIDYHSIIKKRNNTVKAQIIEEFKKLNIQFIKDQNNFLDLKELERFKNIQGIWIKNNNEIHETCDIYKSIMLNKNSFNINDSIEIILNEQKLHFLLKDMSVCFKGETLNLNKLDNLKNIPGVWALWGINKENNTNECLTCGQTENISKEINWTLRVLTNPNLQKLEEEESGCTGRWNFIQKDYINYNYVLINKGEENKEKREIIEAIYAINNNSKFWMPSITQQSNNFIKNIRNYIKEKNYDN